IYGRENRSGAGAQRFAQPDTPGSGLELSGSRRTGCLTPSCPFGTEGRSSLHHRSEQFKWDVSQGHEVESLYAHTPAEWGRSSAGTAGSQYHIRVDSTTLYSNHIHSRGA